MDRRARKSRAAIRAAFEELLARKRYEQITVQEIIDRADVGRSTFYAHFETKDDLLEQTCRELFAHVFERPPDEPGHDFSAATGLCSMLTHIFYHLREDRQRYERLLSGASSELFWSYFRAQFLALAAGCGVEEAAAARGLPQDFYLDYYCAAYIEAVKWWFRTGLAASPEEMAFYFAQVTGGGPEAAGQA